MRSGSSRTSRQTLIKLLKRTALITVSVPIAVVVSFFVVDTQLEIQQHDLVDANLSKIKVGMSSAEVEAMLGWPDGRYLNAEDKSNRLPRSQFSSWFRTSYRYSGKRTDYKDVPINTQGREVWVYENFAPDRLVPAIIFDIKTGKVVQLTKVHSLTD